MLGCDAGEQQPAIWHLLDSWASGGPSWGGPLLHALQQYSQCSWRAPSNVQESIEFNTMDKGQALIQELHWEVEAKVMNMLALITSCEWSNLPGVCPDSLH